MSFTQGVDTHIFFHDSDSENDCLSEGSDTHIFFSDDDSKGDSHVECACQPNNWYKRLSELKSYITVHDAIPSNEIYLGAWIRRENYRYKKGIMPTDYISKWEEFQEFIKSRVASMDKPRTCHVSWDNRMVELKTYLSIHHHCAPNKTKLYNWMYRQKYCYYRGTMLKKYISKWEEFLNEFTHLETLLKVSPNKKRKYNKDTSEHLDLLPSIEQIEIPSYTLETVSQGATENDHHMDKVQISPPLAPLGGVGECDIAWSLQFQSVLVFIIVNDRLPSFTIEEEIDRAIWVRQEQKLFEQDKMVSNNREKWITIQKYL